MCFYFGVSVNVWVRGSQGHHVHTTHSFLLFFISVFICICLIRLESIRNVSYAVGDETRLNFSSVRGTHFTSWTDLQTCTLKVFISLSFKKKKKTQKPLLHPSTSSLCFLSPLILLSDRNGKWYSPPIWPWEDFCREYIFGVVWTPRLLGFRYLNRYWFHRLSHYKHCIMCENQINKHTVLKKTFWNKFHLTPFIATV